MFQTAYKYKADSSNEEKYDKKSDEWENEEEMNEEQEEMNEEQEEMNEEQEEMNEDWEYTDEYNSMHLTYKGKEAKLEVKYDYLELELSPRVVLNILLKLSGMVLLVNYYTETTEQFDSLTFTNKVYNLTLPCVLGYAFGEYIVKGLIIYYTYKGTIGQMQEK